jgi:hypothetical protein
MSDDLGGGGTYQVRVQRWTGKSYRHERSFTFVVEGKRLAALLDQRKALRGTEEP